MILFRKDQEIHKNTINHNENIIDFPANNNNGSSFKFIQQTTGKTGENEIKDVKIMVPLKYLTNIWRTLKVPLINCKISPKLIWSRFFFVTGAAANQEPTYAVTDLRFYVSDITFSSTKGNLKLELELEIIRIRFQNNN